MDKRKIDIYEAISKEYNLDPPDEVWNAIEMQIESYNQEKRRRIRMLRKWIAASVAIIATGFASPVFASMQNIVPVYVQTAKNYILHVFSQISHQPVTIDGHQTVIQPLHSRDGTSISLQKAYQLADFTLYILPSAHGKLIGAWMSTFPTKGDKKEEWFSFLYKTNYGLVFVTERKAAQGTDMVKGFPMYSVGQMSHFINNSLEWSTNGTHITLFLQSPVSTTETLAQRKEQMKQIASELRPAKFR